MSASEQTREARDQVLGLSSCDHADGECALCAEAIDTYVAAVRAQAIGEAIKAVEGMLEDVPSRHSGTFAESAIRTKNLILHTIDRRLRALEDTR